MDTQKLAIDPRDDLNDVENPGRHEGDGGEPLDFYDDEDLYHVLQGDDVDLIESADVAFQAALEVLDEESDTYEYEAHESDEVMALTVAHLVKQMAHNAVFDAHGNPAAAAHAVLHALSKVKQAIVADIGPEGFPALIVEGEAWLVEPT
ncbi:MAG: hypothetical protein ACYTGV_16605 [Planctomycetota bacterium]|jgi:hypothetical protein